MKTLLLVGLGNPGQQFTCSRHNLGIRAVRYWVDARKYSDWRIETEWPAEASKAQASLHLTVIAFFPLTFMNQSGSAVAAYARHHKISVPDIIIVHDDMELPFGDVRYQAEGNAHGHKGVKSIQQSLGTTALKRLRLGIGRPPASDVDAFVLQPFSEQEEKAMNNFLNQTAEEITREIKKRGLSEDG